MSSEIFSRYLSGVIILPLCNLQSVSFTIPEIKDVTKWLCQIKGVPQLYIMAVALYLLPNILAAALFIFPMFRRLIENSDWHLIRFLLWWVVFLAKKPISLNRVTIYYNI